MCSLAKTHAGDDDDDDFHSGYARRPYEPSLVAALNYDEQRLALMTREISQHLTRPSYPKNETVCQSGKENGWKL